MAEPSTPRSRGGKLTRSETVQVRLDPKLRYLADLAARKQRRTLSSFIEWAIEDSLNQVVLSSPGSSEAITLTAEAVRLWDVDEPDRFAKLALRYPELLTHEEQKRWKLICENADMWRGRNDKATGKRTWSIAVEHLIVERLREQWDSICAMATSTPLRAELPSSWLEQPDHGADYKPTFPDNDKRKS